MSGARPAWMIRPASPADVPALSAMVAASYRFGFADILDAATLDQRGADFFAGRFAAQWPSVQIACVHEDACGRPACIGMTQVREGQLDMMFVAPDFAGHGLAQALLADAEARGAVSLECFRDNHRARRFYERAGWILSGAYERDFAGHRYAFVTYGKPRANAPGSPVPA
ncbi:MAG: GNAT family N-acetyltransferase [Beijerinckiaceae bacterium]